MAIPDEELKAFMDDDRAIVNVRYRGRNLTLKIDKNDVSVAQGFNAKSFPDALANNPFDSEDRDTFENFINEFNNLVLDIGSNVSTMQAAPYETGVVPSSLIIDKLNSSLKENANGKNTYNLNMEQTLELIFSLYTFEDLKNEKCLTQVDGQKNRFVITTLPSKLIAPLDDEIIQAAYAVKYPTAGAQEKLEKAQDSVDIDMKYIRNLYRLFPGATRWDRDGNRIVMEEVRATGQATEDTGDLFYEYYGDDAACNIIYNRIKTRDLATGKEKIDSAKANTELNTLYGKGITYLKKLNKEGELKGPYAKAFDDLKRRPDLESRQIDINGDITDWEALIIKLGFLRKEKELEASQTEEINKIREDMLAKLTPAIREAVRKKNLSVTDAEIQASLKQFPISLLLTAFNNTNKNNESNSVFGLNVPITLPLTQTTSLSFLPGANTNGDITIGVGISNTLKADRVEFLTGFSLGASFGPEYGAGIGAAAGAKIKVRIWTADKDGSWNHYLGVQAGVAGGVTAEGFLAISAGPVWEMKCDIDQDCKNQLRKELESKNIAQYTDELLEFKKTNDPQIFKSVATKIRADKSLMSKLSIPADANDAMVISEFKDYESRVSKDFLKTYWPPGVTGVTVSLQSVALMVFTAGIGALFALDIPVSKRLSLLTTQNKTEADLALFENAQVTKKLQEEMAKSFNEQPAQSGGERKLEIAGDNSLDERGLMRTGSSKNGEIENKKVSENILEYNNKLAEIGLMLEKDNQNRIKIISLPTRAKANLKIMVGEDLGVVGEDGQLYLKDPNSLDNLYFYRNDRYYPFNTVSGANQESIILISSNRFFTPEGEFKMPSEIALTKRHDESRFLAEKNESKGEIGKYTGENVQMGNMEDYRKANKEMDDVLGGGAEKETVRDGLEAIAADLYNWKDDQQNTFLKITNQDGRKVMENPSLEKEDLFTFFKKYTTEKGIDQFNGAEGEKLMVQLSAMRYTEMPGKTRDKYHARLEWARDLVLIPMFEERLKPLTENGKIKLKEGETIKTKARDLAQQAIDDLWNISIDETPTPLPDGTTAGVAIGRYETVSKAGFHELLNGGGIKNPYGYIMGKDYTEVLSNGVPEKEYELALVLKGQMTPLAEIKDGPLEGQQENVKEFMNSPLSRKVASLHHLIFVLGKDKYKQITDYYKERKVTSGNQEALRSFTDLVKQLREGQSSGKDAVPVTGADGLTYIFTLAQKLQTGVFNTCTNFTAAYSDEIGLLPPTEAEFVKKKIVVAMGESRTTVSTKLYAEFITLWGGVAGAAVVERPEEPEIPETEIPGPSTSHFTVKPRGSIGQGGGNIKGSKQEQSTAVSEIGTSKNPTNPDEPQAGAGE